MDISIIIPNYNGEKLLEKNLPKIFEAVKDYKKGKIEIIIADDPSTDNSARVIKNFINNIKEKNIFGKTISNKNKKEAGFSKNINRGVSLATGEILILLNSDVTPHKDFLPPLLSHFSDPKVFAVGCMDESIENGKTILRGRGVGRWERGLLVHSKGELNENNTLWASGGSSAFRKSIWNKLKGFDILYNPFYWEDIDLSYRALKSGLKVLFEPKSVVIHEHEKGAIKSKFKPSQIQKIAYRNQFIFIWKNITDSQLIFSHIFWLPYHFINALKRRDKTFFVGFGLAALEFSKIIKSREEAKKLFVIADRQVIKNHNG
jgi:GT2 family glycosyltransferase